MPALFCALTILSSVSAPGQSSSWQRYSAKGFLVMLPTAPSSMEISLPNNFGERSRTGWLFSSYEDKVAYVVLVCDRRRDSLSRFINEVDRYPIRASAQHFDQDFSGEGFTGKQYSFSVNPDLQGVVRFYLTKEKVYVVEALGENIDTPSVKLFFDSFAVGENERAVEIPDPNQPLTDSSASSGNVDDASQIYNGRQVTTRARILFKPEPMYTEEARQHRVTGTVVLRAVLSSTGRVVNLREVTGLPHGLTWQAITAARNIKFIPAIRDGQPVHMWIQLEYNFNLY